MIAGANSIFYGDTLLTTPNADVPEDDALFAALAPILRDAAPAPVAENAALSPA